MLKHLWNTLKICLFGQSTEQLLSKLVWNTVRDFITFFSFVRFCMKFNTFFTLVKLYFSKITLTSFNVANIRLSHILHKTLSRPSFKSAYILKKVYLD